VFLPWVDKMKEQSDFATYVDNCLILYSQQKEVSFAILLNGRAVGRIGLHYLNLQNKNAAIGYWLTKDATGKGVVIKSCKALIDYGFNELGLNRIEIKAAVGNGKSQAIPEKLGFRKEGIMREAELVNNKFLDLFLYSMLRAEWQ
jgi:ribosomal-protein-serine acetyltransferase